MRFPSTRRRRAISMALLAGTLAAGAAQGQGVAAPATVQARQVYDIPPGPLGKTMASFALASGISLAFEPSWTDGLQSPGVSGEWSRAEAARRLLAGSGLEMVARADGSYTLRKAVSDAATLPTITVTGAAGYSGANPYLVGNATSATKTATPLMETTQSISVVTQERMTVQGVQTVSDALSYTAGVYANVAGDNPTDNTLMVRGFQQISTNAYTDGLRNSNTGYFAPEPYGMDRIEVLKGPSSVMYGQGSPGGIINFVSKRPLFESHREVGLSTGSNDRIQGSMDIGDVIDEPGTLAYRLVALGRNADSNIDGVPDDRVYVAPSLTWAPSARTSVTLLASYQRNRNLFTSNLPYSVLDGSNPNGRVPRHRSLNQPGFDKEQGELTNIGYELSHAFSDAWTFQQNFRYGHFKGYEDQLFRNSGVINGTDIARYYQLRDYDSDTYSVDNRLVGKFATGALDHTLLVGLDYQYSKRTADTQTGNAPPINIYHPVRVSIDTSRYTSLLSTDESSRQLGVYLQDQVKLNQWVATLAGRYDWVNQRTTNVLRDVRTDTAAEDFTGRAGLGYAFESGFFPYVSYSESFSPLTGTDINGAQFKPEKAKQYEVGVKYQAPGSDSYVTLAAFDLRRQNVLTTNPQNTSFSVQEGEVRSRGLELEGVLRPVRGLNVIASYTYNDVEVTKDNPNFAGLSNKGKAPVRVPRHLLSLWTDYTLSSGTLEGLTLGAGVRYTGSTFGDAQNTFKVPAYTLVDAMVGYDFGRANPSLRGLSASVNVRNLTDKYYVAGCFLNNACLLGAGRSVIANVSYKW
ncbi:TonB-dependent siderophore receptor [Achromobacter pestifer]|uniref:TonB-dependent siderophore receptor n=1 Tax=Achromobacter pestifer TaxID=1353889 RepID=A0A7D4HRI1_9BURK|nr:TonB-dependent siderophore receptor [Achromobacter pestifer]QKH34513.1 TonB-dependent siderophore receptor [Achromobacter pestifer]